MTVPSNPSSERNVLGFRVRWLALGLLLLCGVLAATGSWSSAGTAAAGNAALDETRDEAADSVVVDAGVAESKADLDLPRETVTRMPAAAPMTPASLLQLPSSAVGAVVIDADANRLFWFENLGESLDRGRELYVAIGKGGPNKVREGDEKTPIGVYRLAQYLEGRNLPPIYGAGAFTMDYPNAWDRLRGRTGGGIWIHGTDKSDEELLPRSSRGCLTVSNDDFAFLLEQLQLGSTPVIVDRGIEWRPAHETASLRRSLAERVDRWRRDWETDTESYLEHYAEDFRSGHMDAAAWRTYKRRVNASKKFIEVELDDLAIYRYPGEQRLYLANFVQSYKSDNFQGTRTKQLYWRKDLDGWRIVYES